MAAVQHDGDEPPVGNVVKWLLRDATVGSVGCWTADGAKISYSTVQRAGEQVQVDFTGTVEPDRLRVSWYSHKTKAGATSPVDYTFAPAPKAE